MDKQPEGIYWGVFKGAYTDRVGKDETPMFIMTNEVTMVAEYDSNGTFTEWVELPEPFKCNVRMFLTEGKSRDYTMKKLALMGFNGDFDEDPTFSDAVHAGVQLECVHNGKYENWSYSEYDTMRKKKPIDKKTLKVLSAQFSQIAKSSQSPTTPPPAIPASGATTEAAQAAPGPTAAKTDTKPPPTGDNVIQNGTDESDIPF